MYKLEKTEDKINFIINMFKHHQHDLTIPEQIALLTLWEESLVINEEYEMAGAVKKEMDKIISKFNTIDIKNEKQLYKKEQVIKISLYKKFFRWFRKIFIKN